MTRRAVWTTAPYRRVDDDDDIQDYKKPWVGLTDEERLEVAKHNMLSGLDAFAKAIEAKLKEKNV